VVFFRRRSRYRIGLLQLCHADLPIFVGGSHTSIDDRVCPPLFRAILSDAPLVAIIRGWVMPDFTTARTRMALVPMIAWKPAVVSTRAT